MLIRDSRDLNNIDWGKMDGLVPAIVQDTFDGRVLMQAYMNREALAYTLDSCVELCPSSLPLCMLRCWQAEFLVLTW